MLADNIKKTPEKLVMKMWIELYWGQHRIKRRNFVSTMVNILFSQNKSV
jgi:hypothetical protein